MKTTTTTTTARTFKTRSEAYAAAAAFIGAEMEHDRAASARAGYPVMMDATGENWISDLGCRYEANRADGVTVNFWVETAPAEATTTRAARAEAARLTSIETAAEATRAAAILRGLRETAADAVALRHVAELDGLAAALETRAEAAETTAARAEAARAAYLETRAALTAADLDDLRAIRPEAVADLATAAVHRAIDRREAETATDGRALRAQYATTRATLSETMNADGIGEAVAELLTMMTPGGWIDGETADGTPRAALPLAYVAAIAAGRALDRLTYADGGRTVKMTARETRANYVEAARRAAATRARMEADGETVPEHVARLASMNDAREAVAALEAEAAERPDDPETRAALRAARADYSAAVAAVAHGMNPTETRRTSDPVAQSPEAAAIKAETLRRVFEALPPEYIDRAAALARAVYEGATTATGRANVAEAAEAVGIDPCTARRVWKALQEAAEAVAAEDGETGRAIARAARKDGRAHAVALRRESVAAATEAARLEAMTYTDDPAPETVATWADVARRTRPERAAYTARFTPADVAALARAFYAAEATR